MQVILSGKVRHRKGPQKMKIKMKKEIKIRIIK